MRHGDGQLAKLGAVLQDVVIEALLDSHFVRGPVTRAIWVE